MALIEGIDLTRTYGAGGAGHTALNHVSLTVDEGDYLAIMGKSGSGKSTLMNLIGLLDRPTSGRLLIEGVCVTTLSSSALAKLRKRYFGFVFQSYNLLPRNSALENVEMPMIYRKLRRRERRRRAEEILDRVGLSAHKYSLPSELSGGEQQRVAIARALVNSPAIILADEPTGALDSDTGRAVLELLEELNKAGCAIVMVTHDIDVANRAGRVLTLHDGRMAGTDTDGLNVECTGREIRAVSGATGGLQ